MPVQDSPPYGAHETMPNGVIQNYLLPVLATITALSFMGGATAMIALWKDVSVMRESMNTLLKSNETAQKKYETEMQEVKRLLQNHEIRLTKGKL
jgi:hypothetical protein